MSNAVTSTGILIRRQAIGGAAPAAITVTGVAIGNPAVVTATGHGLATGDSVTIAGVTGSTPPVNGVHKITVIDEDSFSIPVNVTVAGTGGTATSTGFNTIAEITEVTPGGKSRNKIETSTHNEGTESHVLGILRQADPGLKVNYVGTEQSHVDLLHDIDHNIKSIWQIEYPSGVKRTGEGYVQNFVFDGAPVDGKQAATITLTWAGPVLDEAA